MVDGLHEWFCDLQYWERGEGRQNWSLNIFNASFTFHFFNGENSTYLELAPGLNLDGCNFVGNIQCIIVRNPSDPQASLSEEAQHCSYSSGKLGKEATDN